MVVIVDGIFEALLPLACRVSVRVLVSLSVETAVVVLMAD